MVSGSFKKTLHTLFNLNKPRSQIQKNAFEPWTDGRWLESAGFQPDQPCPATTVINFINLVQKVLSHTQTW